MGRIIIMRNKIFIIVVMALLLTGCRKTCWKSEDLKLWESIETSNLQGVKEVVKDKKIDLENIKVKNGIRGDDKRALAQAISEDPLDVEMMQTLVNAGAKVNSKNGSYLCDIIQGAEIPYSDRVEKVLKFYWTMVQIRIEKMKMDIRQLTDGCVSTEL